MTSTSLARLMPYPRLFHNSSEFEMKYLGETTFCLGLQIEHLAGNIFLHQSLYTRKPLKCFSMDAAHPLSSPMVVRSLDPKKDEFRPCDEGGGMFGT